MNDTPRDSASLEFLYNISRELASDLDLHTLLLRVLLLSLESVGANSGSIIVLDTTGEPVDSAIVYSHQVFEHTNKQLRSTLEAGLAGWVARNRQMAIIEDTSRDARWEIRPDDAPDQTGAKSAVGLPIMARDELVGVMTLVHPVPGTFQSKHGTLVQTIADQAGIAILNARLYDESRRRARAMTALAESAATLTASLGTAGILQRILTQVHQALEVESVFLALIDSEEAGLCIRAATGKAAESLLGAEIPPGAGAAGWVAEQNDTIVINDLFADQRVSRAETQVGDQGVRAVACAPIRHEGRVIGVLQAQNPVKGEFGPDAEIVLQGIGGLAGSIIRHGQLFDSLTAAHQSYQDLFEDSIDPILITDWDGNISKVNRQAGEMSGYSKADLQATAVQKIHKLSGSPDPFKKLAEMPLGKAIIYESSLEAPSGDIPIQVHVRRILLDGEECLQWIFRDIRERKNLDRLRDDMLSMVYHDLRSPLANVVYGLDSLEAVLPPDPTVRTVLEIAMRATGRIQELTDSMLDIKAMEAGQPIAQPEPANLKEMAEQALKAVSISVDRRGQNVALVVPEDFPALFVDPNLIRRVLINLLENAVKFTPAGGSISVGAESAPSGARIWVQDSGPGIARHQRKIIFNKYARLNGKISGLGLGLAFCRLAVESHGGQIWAESAPGEGSRFIFSLPPKAVM